VLGVRRLLAAAVVAGAVLVGAGSASLLVPATSAASCAGCAQYTNPLGSTTQSVTQTASQTTSPPVTRTATAAPPSTTPAAGGTVAPAETTATTDPQPTATAASGVASGSGTTASDPSLPHTGYDSWTVVGFGVVLLAGGLVVRRRLRRT
jgi:LPXTG-motif cell wall-anchored protein